MAALAPTNSATPSLQSSLIRSKLEVARREAEQAQKTVSQLRSEVASAEKKALQRNDKVRSLTDQSRQTDPTYQFNAKAATPDVPLKTQELLAGLYRATSAKGNAADQGLKSNPLAAPVVNPQGQATGRIVNIAA